MKHFPKLSHRKQAGITLVETAIALAIAAVVVASAFAGFQANARRSEVRDNSQLISEMVADTKQLFGPTNRYSQLTTAVAMGARIVPNNLHVDMATGVAKNSYGGQIQITNDLADATPAATANNNDQAMLVFENVPRNQCVDLTLSVERIAAGVNVADNTVGSTITSATFGTAGAVVKANTEASTISIDDVQTACTSGTGTKDLVLIFNRN